MQETEEVLGFRDDCLSCGDIERLGKLAEGFGEDFLLFSTDPLWSQNWSRHSIHGLSQLLQEHRNHFQRAEHDYGLCFETSKVRIYRHDLFLKIVFCLENNLVKSIKREFQS